MSYQRFTKDIGIISLTQLVIFLKGLIALPIIAKLLGAENYGVWEQLGVTLSLVTLAATLGLPYTLVRFLAAEKDKKEIQDGIYSVLTIVFAVVLVIFSGIFLFSASISSFFGNEKVLVQILAFAIIFDCLNLVFLGIFRAFRQIKKYSCFMIFQSLGEVGLLAATVLLGYGMFGAVLSLLIIRLINFFIMGGYIIKKIGVKVPNFSKTKEYLKFGLPTVASDISFWVVQSSDRYLIGSFLGVIYVGYYAPAYIIGSIVVFFIGPFSLVLPIVLSKFFDENKISDIKTYLKYSLKYFLMMAIPSAFGLSILSKQLLTIFSTSEIASNAYFITPFIVLSILLYGICDIFTQIIALKKKTKITGSIWIGAAFLNFGLNLIFIPKFGIIGAAITTFFAYAFAFILTWYYSFREFQFEIDWKFIIKSVFASILMTLFIFRFSPMGLWQTIIAIVSGALLYGILIFLLRGFNEREFEFLKGLFGKNKL